MSSCSFLKKINCYDIYKLSGSSIDTKNGNNCYKTSAQKRTGIISSKVTICANFQRALRWGWSGILAYIAAWCVVHLSFSSSDYGDPLMNVWDEYGMTAEQKLNTVWQMMISNREPEPWPSLLEQLTRLFITQTDDVSRLKLQQTFRPFGSKKKAIHTQSAYGRIKWKAVESPFGYTGMFAEQNVDGILSFSLAPNTMAGNFSSNCGASVKLLRDYALPSGFVAMFPLPIYRLLTPLSSQWNIFSAGPLCTHLSLLGSLGLLLTSRHRPPTFPPKFVFRYPGKIGLLNLGNATKSGAPVAHPNIPYSICLRPNSELSKQFKFQPPWSHPVEMLRKVTPGTLLFDVIAIDHPTALLDFPYINRHTTKVAEILSDSEFVSSKWGDQTWFGHHQDWSLDLECRPDWKPHLQFRTLLLEGWAYMPISPPIGPTLQQFQLMWFPFFATIHQLFANPKVFGQFVCKEVGLCRLSEVIINAITSHGTAGSLSSKPEIYAYRVATDEANLPSDIHSTVILRENPPVHLNESNEEKVKDDSFTGFGNSSDTLKIAWEEFVNEMFSLSDMHNATDWRVDMSSTVLDPPPFPTVAFSEPLNLQSEEGIAREMQPSFAIQGHYMLPTSLLGWQQIISSPSIMAAAAAAAEHLIEPYHYYLSSSDFTIILEELMQFFSNHLKISKFFERLQMSFFQ